MEAAETQQWFLRKQEDGTVFGPLSFEQLARWASTAQIAPHDSVSADQQSWIKAPMLAELGMDWLVEVTSERYYGPTTLGAVFEFMRLGEITSETFVINTCDGTRRQIAELEPPVGELAMADSGAAAPETEGMAIDFEDRIRDLEQSLSEEREALRDCETRYRELEARYRELLIVISEDGSVG
ncbi:MAG: hypothetical protein ACJ8JD_12600 [Chthoniobacterales bacterium]